MPDKIKHLLEKYWDQFGEGFPLYQASHNWGKIEYDIKKCLRENVRAPELMPDQYGAVEGQDY